MKLRDLCLYRKLLLELINSRLTRTPLSDNIGLLDRTLVTTRETFNQYSDSVLSMHQQCETLAKGYDKVTDQLQELIVEVDNDINKWSDEMFEEYKEIFTVDTVYQHLLKLQIPDKVKEDIKNKVRLYGSNWRYPGLQIFPNDAEWIKPMTTMDPLYITGTSLSALNDVVEEYPRGYKNRLRSYELRNLNFQSFPQGQFSLVFCLWAFKYLHSDYVELAITRIFDLLRPGGVLMFGFNNCITSNLIDHCEDQKISYYNVNKLKQLVEKIGYEIVALTDYDGFGSFAEIKKPGELTTSKLHQALGKVISKSPN